MDRAEIETRVKKVLAEQLAVDEQQVVPDARFAEDLNADSLDLVEAVLALEEEWSIEIPEDEIAKRVAEYQSPEPRYTSGVLAKYARHVGSAAQGAVTS